MTMSHALELESVHESHAPPKSERLGADACAEKTSFAQIVTSEYPYVGGLVARLLGWKSDVDDLVQEVFVAALAAWPRFRGQCTARTWLTRIALNKCRSFQRKTWLRRHLFAAWQHEREREARWNASPTDSLECYDQVRAAMGSLRQRDREVIVLHYLEHWSVAEIAGMLNVSSNAVEVRLTRARQRLKQILQQEIQ
jgi:RNA polymerase sigma-70 factor (ECF subfamily)